MPAETQNHHETGCLGPSRIVAFLDGALPPRERVLAEAHLAGCDDCRQLVSALAPDPAPALPFQDTAPPGPPDALAALAAQPALAPGQIVAGKYRVERVLGEGGMGMVLAAEHVALRQRVALKFLRPGPGLDRQASVRFLREARVAARLSSEHVARVLDYGLLPGGAPFLVLEYLEGEDLGALIERRGPLPLDEALGLLFQAGEALAVAHAAGIVHRDIKPSNIFVTRRADGSSLVKLLDFGIAKADGFDTDGGASTGGAFLGSPRYASPEQFQSATTVDARSDVWALGAVAYELLSGRPPFDGDTLTSLIAAILTSEPAPLPALPPDVAEAILRCLRKPPLERPASVAELLTLLAPHAPDEARVLARRAQRMSPASLPPSSLPPPVSLAPPISLAPPASFSPASSLSPSASLSPSTTPPPSAPGPTRPRALAAVAGALLLGTAGFFSLRSPTPAQPVAAAAEPPATASAPAPQLSVITAPAVASASASSAGSPAPASVAASASVAVKPGPRKASGGKGESKPTPPTPQGGSGMEDRK